MHKLLLCLALLSLSSAAHAMTFEGRCMGNAVESCFIIAEGEITADTPDQFAALGQSDAGKVLLNSPGGHLGAGIRLGRLIREGGYETLVGTRASFEANEYPPSGGECLSACSYAFLGGVIRSLSDNSDLGFHQFKLGANTTVDAAQLTEVIEGAQEVSAQLIAYLVEMGADARVFTLASGKTGNDMHLITAQEATEYDLVTPRGYGPFYLEPYGKGLVAASKRLDAPTPYDLVAQMTAYCKKGAPKLLFHAPQHGLTDQSPAPFVMNFETRSDRTPASAVSIRTSESGAYLEVSLTAKQARAIESTTILGMGFEFPRAAGGQYPTYFELSDMDRKMIQAAFKFCLYSRSHRGSGF